MRGQLYACEWLEDAEYGTMVAVASRTRALWVRDAGLLFQWPLPSGTVQVAECHSFPPAEDKARVTFLEDQSVPYAAIRAARGYLEQMGRIRAQEDVIQRARDRVTDAAIRSEGRLQAALDKAGIQATSSVA